MNASVEHLAEKRKRAKGITARLTASRFRVKDKECPFLLLFLLFLFFFPAKGSKVFELLMECK